MTVERIMRILAGFMILSGLSQALAVESWPQFRGPAANGLAEQKLPAEWSNDKNIAWKVEVPGAAWSQPVVWGDKIYLGCCG